MIKLLKKLFFSLVWLYWGATVVILVAMALSHPNWDEMPEWLNIAAIGPVLAIGLIATLLPSWLAKRRAEKNASPLSELIGKK
uniref:hypothetical protein n=1 Tax=Thaumasiovibrio occultus TaxID=1891184 RepID=UPI000B34C07D|nr:hypothetical protein [Thaumasiovibrio occultus]